MVVARVCLSTTCQLVLVASVPVYYWPASASGRCACLQPAGASADVADVPVYGQLVPVARVPVYYGPASASGACLRLRPAGASGKRACLLRAS